MRASTQGKLQSVSVHIPCDSLKLEGELAIPATATGLVIFAHGSGSGRHSPRNTFVVQRLQQAALATLLVDLLSEAEDSDYRCRFDIDLLTERLAAVTDWATHDERTEDLAIGYFGASTGAAAAICAAAGAGSLIKAVVSRGGRVDLADTAAELLCVPVLLIVGQNDPEVREANEEFYLKLTCRKAISVVPNATHLFEEPGALVQVAGLAAGWFKKHLRAEP
jgi:putative phosphoribosyl transferase